MYARPPIYNYDSAFCHRHCGRAPSRQSGRFQPDSHPDWTNTCRYDGAMDLSLDGETLVYAGDDPVNGTRTRLGSASSLFNVVCVGGGPETSTHELPVRPGCGRQRRRQHRTWRQLRS